MNTTYIYGLRDPRNGRVRYVGKSNSPKARLIEHIGEAKRGEETYCYNWIRLLLRNDLTPEIIVLEEVLQSGWVEAEIKWIAEYRKEDNNLTNMTDGGNAPPIFEHTSESREIVSKRFKGKKISEEHKKNISKRKLAAYHPHRGKHLSEEHKQKLRETNLGRKMSDEARKNISKSKMGDKNPNCGREFSKEHLRNMSNAQKFRRHSKETRQKMSLTRKKQEAQRKRRERERKERLE